jgi:hypothetical protein
MQAKSTAPLRRASGRFRTPGKELAPSHRSSNTAPRLGTCSGCCPAKHRSWWAFRKSAAAKTLAALAAAPSARCRRPCEALFGGGRHPGNRPKRRGHPGRFQAGQRGSRTWSASWQLAKMTSWRWEALLLLLVVNAFESNSTRASSYASVVSIETAKSSRARRIALRPDTRNFKEVRKMPFA